MDQKTGIIERYFKLSDLASSDERALKDIIDLFSSIAVVKGANGFVANTPAKITSFFTHFFQDNQELHHLCHVVMDNSVYKAEWVVAGRKRSGELFAYHGFDNYEFDRDGKIKFLQVEIIQ